MKTLADADPAAPTACSQWTVHDLVAHLAAGAKENADLIEDRLAGRVARATRTFAEREPSFVAMPDERLREELIHQSGPQTCCAGSTFSQGAGRLIPVHRSALYSRDGTYACS